MDCNEIVEISKKLHDIADDARDLVGDEISSLKRELRIDPPVRLREAFDAVIDDNRLLNIGIVGRVKAGKSTLLNVLFFDGHLVLPKAATPMTAALTTLTWGERFAVSVDFYSDEDRRLIAERNDEYEREFNKKKNRIREELLKKQGRLGTSSEDDQRIDERAEKRALREMEKHVELAAAHDQLERMRQSSLDPNRLDEYKMFTAVDANELSKVLGEYVGAEGQFMPFTKSVNVEMPLDRLKGLRVIDTPGLNDPVQSREARTVDLLKICDVIFIISPAGQFLNEQDEILMSRITTREGVREIMLVSSQVDSQLFGSEKRADLNEALNFIGDELSKRAREVLGHLSTEVGPVFDTLRQSVQDSLLHSSGICEALRLRFDKRETWDDGERHAWKLLAEGYPDYFPTENADRSLNSLSRIANVDALRVAINRVAVRKDEITRKKLADLCASEARSLENYRDRMIQLFKDRINLIQNTDTAKLKETLKTILRNKEVFSLKVQKEYDRCKQDYIREMRVEVDEKINSIYSNMFDNYKASEEVYTRKYTQPKGGALNYIARVFSHGGIEEKSEKELRISTPQVLGAIEDFIHYLDRSIDELLWETRKNMDKDLFRILVGLANELLDAEDGRDMDAIRAVDSVMNSILKKAPIFDVSIPDKLRGLGTVESDQAKIFRDEVNEFMLGLKRKARDHARRFIEDVDNSISGDLSGDIVKKIEERVNALKNQIECSTQIVARLERFLKRAEAVAVVRS